ncbi:transcriptional regulator, TetR family [Methylomagnum ishizawai]|uniref:Transcriptional regulator, TetR family n=1 Tax=Methylomagnum ishizawai TaxID=1760988 RepID=A0A1Y6CYD2_9GAMM|nr:TetR/AcrR family transcriptional regulator [Methylomagnum ishizawai]SMF95669.1 transcriptional regulator, TetR family [Methylomagnum ishizawai]
MSEQPKLGRPRDPERMRRVIEVAEQLFLEQGFERTSVEAVAKASGVSKVTIYAYFPTKKALFEATIGKRIDAAFDFGSDVSLPYGEPRLALTLIGRHFLGLIRADEVIRKQRVLFAEAGVQQDACSAFFQQGPLGIVARVRGFLDSAVTAGSLVPHDTGAGADQFLSLFLGSAHIKAMLGLGKPTSEEDERLLERNVDMFMKAYGRD